jgi:NAD(P)-dependent dehydrogenase (short-subunit alcohol dehydrogenase family)
VKLQGKIALVTGGNSGIGLATARLFIAEGADVIITGRDQETLDSAAAELGPNALAVQADVADAAAREHLFEIIGEKCGHLDIVVANAGIGGATPLGNTDEQTFTHILNVNVTGVFFTVQGALPFLKSGASVILIGSVVATLGPPGSSAYVASKGAVRAMSRTLAAELSPKGIRVNVVSPGAINTPIWKRGGGPANPAAGAERAKQFLSKIPAGRFGEADEIAKAILYLASDDSSYVQGAEIFVDGGAVGSPMGTAPPQQTFKRGA